MEETLRTGLFGGGHLSRSNTIGGWVLLGLVRPKYVVIGKDLKGASQVFGGLVVSIYWECHNPN